MITTKTNIHITEQATTSRPIIPPLDLSKLKNQSDVPSFIPPSAPLSSPASPVSQNQEIDPDCPFHQVYVRNTDIRIKETKRSFFNCFGKSR